MVKPDIEISMGIDRARIEREYKEMVRLGSRESWKIAKAFERAEQAKERAASEQRAKIQRGYQRLERANQVAFVAMAAGVGVFTKALQKAAESNKELESDLNSVARAKDSFLTSLGNDLAPFINGLDQAIEKVQELREELATGAANYIGDDFEIANSRIQGEIAAIRTQKFNDTVKRQDLERQMTIDGGGPGADEARDQAAKRAFMQQLERDGIARADRGPLIEKFEANQRKKAEQRAKEEQARARREARAAEQRRLDARAALLEQRAQDNPNDRDAFFAASLAKEEAGRHRILTETNGGGGSAEQREAATNRQRVNSGRGIRERQAFDDRIAAEEKAAQIATERLGIERKQNEIELMRAKGQDKMAEQAQIQLDFAREKLEIEHRAGINDEQRAALIAQRASVRDARLGGPAETAATDNIGLGPGLAGGSTLIRQLTAGNSAAKNDDPVAKNTATLVQQNKELIQAVKDAGGSTAIAG